MDALPVSLLALTSHSTTSIFNVYVENDKHFPCCYLLISFPLKSNQG